jgi:hypothetical protein
MSQARLCDPTQSAKTTSFRDVREAFVQSPAEDAFRPIRCIGGLAGWYHLHWLWRLRGSLDAAIGGPGLSRGRRSPDELEVGDVLDCWRVESYVPDSFLRLALEMKAPGSGWLEFEVTPCDGGYRIRQTATFTPRGILGRLYWYLEYPFHRLVFPGMLRAIVARAAPSWTAGIHADGR